MESAEKEKAALISGIANQWTSQYSSMMDITLSSAQTLGSGIVIYPNGSLGDYFQATAEL